MPTIESILELSPAPQITEMTTFNPSSSSPPPPPSPPPSPPPPQAECGRYDSNHLLQEFKKLAMLVSREQDLDREESPQNRAWRWISGNSQEGSREHTISNKLVWEGWHDRCLDLCPDDENALQRYIMAVFYYS